MSDHNEQDRPECEFHSARWLRNTIVQLTNAWENQDMDELERLVDDLEDYSWFIEY